MASLRAACARHVEADDYATGSIGEPHTSPGVKRILRSSGASTMEDFPYAAIPIRTVASGLAIQQPVTAPPADSDTMDDPDGDGQAGDADADAALADLWKSNQLEDEINSRLMEECSTYGEGFVFVWPVFGEDDYAEVETVGDDGRTVMVLPDSVTAESVDILVNSPHTVCAVYDDANPLRLQYVIKSWERPAPSDPDKIVTYATLYYDKAVEQWETEPGKSGAKAEEWILTGTKAHNYGQPFHHLRNHRPLGRPEHRLGYGPQQAINKIIATDMATIDFSAFPQRWMLMDPQIDDPLTNLGDPDFPEDDDDPTDGTSPLRADPATVWRLWAKSVGQFDPPDADNLLKRFDRYITAMAELTGIPDIYFGRGTGNTPSGAALRTLKVPVDDIRAARRRAYGPVLQGVFEHSMSLLGFDDITVPIVWRPDTTVTDDEGWATISTMVGLGVPFEAAVQIVGGFTPEQAREWSTSGQGLDIGRRLTLLQGLAAALPALSEAETAAGLPPGLVAATIAAMLAQITDGVDPEVGDQMDEVYAGVVDANLALAGSTPPADVTAATPDPGDGAPVDPLAPPDPAVDGPVPPVG